MSCASQYRLILKARGRWLPTHSRGILIRNACAASPGCRPRQLFLSAVACGYAKRPRAKRSRKQPPGATEQLDPPVGQSDRTIGGRNPGNGVRNLRRTEWPGVEPDLHPTLQRLGPRHSPTVFHLCSDRVTRRDRSRSDRQVVGRRGDIILADGEPPGKFS